MLTVSSLSVCSHNLKTAQLNFGNFVHVACGHGSVLLRQRCNTFCTSGFMDDVMFSYNEANGPASSTTLCFEKIRQVAVPFGRQITTRVSGRVQQNAAQGAKSAIYDGFVNTVFCVPTSSTALPKEGNFTSLCSL